MSTYCAFNDSNLIAKGTLIEVALRVQSLLNQEPGALPQIFNEATGALTEVDLSGDPDVISAWIALNIADTVPVTKTRGRPKLGVISREITLLPRHWAWLESQPGSASVILRRLIDEASKDPKAERRTAQDATYRFAQAIAGNFEGYEEGMRALYARDPQTFTQHISTWPIDIQTFAQTLAYPAW